MNADTEHSVFVRVHPWLLGFLGFGELDLFTPLKDLSRSKTVAVAFLPRLEDLLSGRPE
jgi:hypothetical protein